MNAEFFRSDRAPEFLLFKLQTIDGRYPTLNDASVLPEIWQRYKPMLVDHGYLLLRRAGAVSPAVGRRLLREARCQFDEPVFIPTTGVFWLEVEVDDSLLGKLRAFLYHRPAVTMHVASEDQRLTRWLLPTGMARLGFLIGPALNTTPDFHRLLNGEEPGPRTVGFDVHAALEDRALLASEIRYRLYEVDPPPAAD